VFFSSEVLYLGSFICRDHIKHSAHVHWHFPPQKPQFGFLLGYVAASRQIVIVSINTISHFFLFIHFLNTK